MQHDYSAEPNLNPIACYCKTARDELMCNLSLSHPQSGHAGLIPKSWKAKSRDFKVNHKSYVNRFCLMRLSGTSGTSLIWLCAHSRTLFCPSSFLRSMLTLHIHWVPQHLCSHASSRVKLGEVTVINRGPSSEASADSMGSLIAPVGFVGPFTSHLPYRRLTNGLLRYLLFSIYNPFAIFITIVSLRSWNSTPRRSERNFVVSWGRSLPNQGSSPGFK